MAAYSQPTAPQIDPDIREDLLKDIWIKRFRPHKLDMMKCKEDYSVKGDKPPYMIL